MQFMDVDRSVAEGYVRYVRGTHEYRLWELAQWVSSTGGPIDDLDGSVESLEPLWVWFKKFADAGLPAVPLDAYPEKARLFKWRDEVEAERLRRRYAIEALGHYAFEVVRRYVPGAEWTLLIEKPNSRIRNSDHQETVVVLPSCAWLMPEEFGNLMRYWDGSHVVQRDDVYREMMARQVRVSKLPPLAPGGSLLSHYVGAPAPVAAADTAPVPTFTIPDPPKISAAEDTIQTLNWTPLFGVKDGNWLLVSDEWEGDIQTAPPISATNVFSVLTRNGYLTPDGERLTLARLHEGSTLLRRHPSSDVDVTLHVYKKKIRAVYAAVLDEEHAGVLWFLKRVSGATLYPVPAV